MRVRNLEEKAERDYYLFWKRKEERERERERAVESAGLLPPTSPSAKKELGNFFCIDLFFSRLLPQGRSW